MVKIVDGKLYDTEKSELIYMDDLNDRQYFMTKKRNFFVVYATGDIFPKTEVEIKALLGKRDAKKYLELFGDEDLEEA